MATFNDIPFEVFMAYLLPLISIKEIGALSMVNKVWKDTCDDQETWKNLYLRTIRADILDTSVHIGPKWRRLNPHLCRYLKIDNCTQWEPFDPRMSVNCRCDYDLLNHGFPSCCIPRELKESLKPYINIRKDGYRTNQFPFSDDDDGSLWRARRFDTSEYCSYVKEEWIKYNRERGLSTVNLCQCVDHYEFDTLGMPGGCRNYKSFKKITLKKLKTSKKHEKKQQEKETLRKKKKYEKYLASLKILENDYLNSLKEDTKKQITLDNLDCAINSL